MKLSLSDRLIDRINKIGHKTTLTQDEFRKALLAAADSQMMGTALIANPAGSDGLNASIGSLTISAINGDSVALVPGQLLEIVTPYAGTGAPGYSTNGPPFTVKRSATTADFLLAGVVAGPTPTTVASASGASYPVGAVVEVVVLGPSRILMDDTGGGTTAGDVITQSTTTAGQGKDAGTTAVLYKTIGTLLQAVTITSGSALVNAYIAKG